MSLADLGVFADFVYFFILCSEYGMILDNEAER